MNIQEGDIVRLKSLERIVREQNVSNWKEITSPTINSQGYMNHLFGDLVEIIDPVYSINRFKARGLGESVEWYFNINWIEGHQVRLPDELFEI